MKGPPVAGRAEQPSRATTTQANVVYYGVGLDPGPVGIDAGYPPRSAWTVL